MIHPYIALVSLHSCEALQCCKDSADSCIRVLHMQGERELCSKQNVVGT